jgi:hypothetical protein
MMEQNVQQPLCRQSGSPIRHVKTMGNRIASLSLGIPATTVFTIAMIAGVFVHNFLFKVRRDDQALL